MTHDTIAMDGCFVHGYFGQDVLPGRFGHGRFGQIKVHGRTFWPNLFQYRKKLYMNFFMFI